MFFIFIFIIYIYMSDIELQKSVALLKLPKQIYEYVNKYFALANKTWNRSNNWQEEIKDLVMKDITQDIPGYIDLKDKNIQDALKLIETTEVIHRIKYLAV